MALRTRPHLQSQLGRRRVYQTAQGVLDVLTACCPTPPSGNFNGKKLAAS